LQGEDLSAEIRANFAQQAASYARLLAAARGDVQTHAIDLLPGEPRLWKEPRELQLRQRWQCRAVARPGNLLVVLEGDDLRLLTLDGERAVAELDSEGRVARRVELPIEPDQISFLRTALTGDGQRRFAAAGMQGRAAYLFDDQWNLLFRYPPANQAHEGITIIDAQLGDLDLDGHLELVVGLGGGAGVHAVSHRGKRKWSNAAVPSVLSLAFAPPDAGQRGVLVTGESGQIVRLDADGRQASHAAVSGSATFHLFRGNFPEAVPPAYCGLTYSESGNLVALGLDRQLQSHWSYPLPLGSYRNPIGFLTSGNVLDGAYWVIAGSDGTVHFVRHDGRFSDHFASGEVLTGIAAKRWAGQSWLFTAANGAVTAWTILRK
jgi:hypothetical protein